MKFPIVVFTALLALASACAMAQTPSPSPTQAYQRSNKHERVRRYVNSMFGYSTIGKNLAGAGISTWTNSPEDWGTHWDGFGKRFASNMGKGVIKNTTAFGLEEALKFDSRYVPAPKKGIGYRIGNALISPFVARNKHGHRVFGLPRVAGTYTAHVIAAETWYPDRYTWRDGLRSGTISLGTSAIFNLFKEFSHRK